MNRAFDKKIKDKKTKAGGGFSLLELILAIAIFSVGSFGMATVLIDSNISTRLSSDRIEALTYAKEGIEAVKAIRNNDWANIDMVGEYGLLNTDGVWSLSGSADLINDKYTRVLSIINTPGANPATSSKTITATISWALTGSRIASTSITTILTDWRNN